MIKPVENNIINEDVDSISSSSEDDGSCFTDAIFSDKEDISIHFEVLVSGDESVDQKITDKDIVDQGLVEKDVLTQDRVEQDQAVVKELLVDMVKRVRKAVDRYDGMKEDERAKQLKLKLKNKH